MRKIFTSVLLLGAIVGLLITSCGKQQGEPVPPTPWDGVGCPPGAALTDIDGNVYPVVTIGEKCWMASNLRTTRYRDGTPIPTVIDGMAWSQLTSHAWSYYWNDSVYDDPYGKLYNWFAAVDPRLCPQGWHLPTDVEWQQLESALGMPISELDIELLRGVDQNVGGKMKSMGFWSEPNSGATDESGFAGLPGGFRGGFDGGFNGMNETGYWWSSTAFDPDAAWYRQLYFLEPGVVRFRSDKRNAFCVRCVRD